MVENIDKLGDYRILVLPDHPTPLALRTHSANPVPYTLFGSKAEYVANVPVEGYSEKAATSTNVVCKEAID